MCIDPESQDDDAIVVSYLSNLDKAGMWRTLLNESLPFQFRSWTWAFDRFWRIESNENRRHG
jgi:hypothetical protein